ncbi:MAG: ATP-dependent DNA helicase [Hyphomicrobiales bacterium]|nr:ATP-dependent DNA helicase [Hyphomicrobiales bacterium]
MTSLPDLPAITLNTNGATRITADGEIQFLELDAACEQLEHEPHILCHKPSIRKHFEKIRLHPQSADVLELFAFVFPARFCAPSPGGLAQALEMSPPQDATASTSFLYEGAVELLKRCAKLAASDSCVAIAHVMNDAGWIWGESVLEALGNPEVPATSRNPLHVWNALPEWKEVPTRNTEGGHEIKEGEASERLEQLLAKDRRLPRDGQFKYAEGAAKAFAPRQEHNPAQIVLAEAGTGIGKTLGYLSGADVWAHRNQAQVWISTYTKNLQSQLEKETGLLFANEHEQRNEVVLRKGRDNYLCLLRLEDWLGHASMDPTQMIQAGLIARWVSRTTDGALDGGDFPNWLMSDVQNPVNEIRDRNRECIHASCPHYRKCFAESVARRARQAPFVLANHALVMTRLARSQTDMVDKENYEKPGAEFPSRFIFDEAQHLFDVSDGVFSLHCSALEMGRLRRWIVGTPARRRRTRVRGLRARVLDILKHANEDIEQLLADISAQARILAGPEWRNNLENEAPKTEGEIFLNHVKQTTLEGNRDEQNGFYSIDIPCVDLPGPLLESAASLAEEMRILQGLLEQLCEQIIRTDTVDNNDDSGQSAETLISNIHRHPVAQLSQWRKMLENPITPQENTEEKNKFIDRFLIERKQGRIVDVGMHRHWIDPTEPFARQLLEPAQGALITSATLHDSSSEIGAGDANENGFDWKIAEMRTGAAHLAIPPKRFSVNSPFNYQQQAKIFAVSGIDHKDEAAVANAYSQLFLAAGGGGLGLFTAVRKLQKTHPHIASRLQDKGIDLFAQHVDAMDTATLMNIFRTIEASCLLGCDAMRDGVDVPGRSLRIVVLDKIPYARTDVLHRARRKHFGGSTYDDMLTRFRLRQAFGRLIRTEDDKGVFILLTRLSSRFREAFPADVTPETLTLEDAVIQTRDFLQPKQNGTDSPQ